MLWFMPKICIIHIVHIWALLYNVLENYKKICNDSLLLLSLQIQWFIQDAVQLPDAVLTAES